MATTLASHEALMFYPEARLTAAWQYHEAQSAAFELESILQQCGIAINSGSYLEKHIIDVMRLVEHKRQGTTEPLEPDFRATYRTLIGVHELATLIVEANRAGQLQALIQHLRLLNDGNALQNQLSSGSDQVTNKLFELMVGSLAAQCGSDLSLDDPYISTGRNPDVLATMGGRRWGLACKVLHSLHPQGFIEHLEKGVDQIERSDAEVGAVVFNLKNVLFHDQIWPLAPIPGAVDAAGNPELGPAAWPDFRIPYTILMNQIVAVGETLASYLPDGYLESALGGKKSIPGFLVWGHSVTGIEPDGRPAAASVRALTVHQLRDLLPFAKCAIECLNWAAHVGAKRGPKPDC